MSKTSLEWHGGTKKYPSHISFGLQDVLEVDIHNAIKKHIADYIWDKLPNTNNLPHIMYSRLLDCLDVDFDQLDDLDADVFEVSKVKFKIDPVLIQIWPHPIIPDILRQFADQYYLEDNEADNEAEKG